MTQKEQNMKGPLRVSYINTPFIATIESREREREREVKEWSSRENQFYFINLDNYINLPTSPVF